MNIDRFNKMLERDDTGQHDLERKALFLIISGNDELWRLADQIYDFKDRCIEPEILESGICSSSKQLIKIGFNLYNGFNTDSPLDLLSGLDLDNFELAMKAIRLRMNRL